MQSGIVYNEPVHTERETTMCFCVCSFEFLYKQAVTSTDAFLGMMDKDASSACCEDLELRIDLPNVKGLSGNFCLMFHQHGICIQAVESHPAI